MLVAWTPLRPSLRERRWRRSAAAVAAAAALLLAVAAVQTDPLDLRLALGALIGAALAPLALRRKQDGFEVCVDDRGALWVRRTADPDPDRPAVPLHCLYATPWLMTFRCDTGLIAIWPDSVAADTYRRVWVSVRWNVRRPLAPPAPRTDDD